METALDRNGSPCCERLRDTKRPVWLLAVAWTVVVCGLFFLNYRQIYANTRTTAITEARAALKKDVTFRLWGALHGGVYVPITERTPPNLLLEVPEREIVTPSGRQLTLMNPAYMTRQIFSFFAENLGPVGHLTSLNPRNPLNAPDEWERQALIQLENGFEEVTDFVEKDQMPTLHMMIPTITRQECLQCHAQHGYQVGQVRGGISIKLPLALLALQERQSLKTSGYSFFLLWLVGLVSLAFAGQSIRRQGEERAQIISCLQQTKTDLQQERDLFMSGSVVVFKWKNAENWPVEYVSQNVTNVLGYSRQALTQGNLRYADVIHPQDIERVKREVETHCRSRVESFTHEPYRIVQPDGKAIWVMDFTTIVSDNSGIITHFLGYLVDVSPWKRAEESLRESEERLSLALQCTGMGMWDWDIPSGRLMFSSRWAEILGYSMDELEPCFKTWETLLHPGDRALVMAQLNGHLSGHTSLYQTEQRLRKKDGSWKWIMVVGKVILRDGAGNPLRALGTHYDLTERKQVELELLKSRENHEKAQRLAHLGHWELHHLTNRLDWSEEVFRIFGERPGSGSLTLEQFYERVYPADRSLVKETFDMAVKQKSLYSVKHRIQSPDGRIRFVCELAETVYDEHDRPVATMGTVQDVTERTLFEQQVIQQAKLAAVGQLAAGIAHDFNNILTGILGFSELHSQSSDVPFDVRSDMAKIAQLSYRAAGLVKQILDFSRKSIRTPKSVSLRLMVSETLSMLKRTIPENIQIDQVTEADNDMVFGDVTQIHQVITNLVVNSRDAMPHGGKILIRVSKNVETGDTVCNGCGIVLSGEWLSLSVEDSGEGIPDDVIGKVFEPFFTTKDVGKGSGLGLSQVLGIVQQHGGHIAIRSVAGKGTTVICFLPLLEVPHDSSASCSVSTYPPGYGETILLVDDEKCIRSVMSSVLKRIGYQVLTANNGLEALRIFRANKDDIKLILSDMVMPEMSGAKLFETLKQEDSQIPFFLMTGYPLGEEDNGLLESGVVGWLQKPVPIKSLAETIRKTLDSEKRKGRLPEKAR